MRKLLLLFAILLGCITASAVEFVPEEGKLYTLGTARGYLPNYYDYSFIYPSSLVKAGAFRITKSAEGYTIYNESISSYLSAASTRKWDCYVFEPDGTFSIIAAKEVDADKGEEGKWIIQSNVTGNWIMFGGPETQFLNDDSWKTVDAGDMWMIEEYNEENHRLPMLLYTSTDGQVVTPNYRYYNTAFDAKIVSNTYENGQGIILFDDAVTMFGNGAFSSCKNLATVQLPQTVTTIGENVFYRCINLTTVEIPNSVTTIGRSAFERCSGLKSVVIPNSVTWIRERAFYGCSRLTVIKSLNPVPPTIYSSTFSNFDKDACTLIVPEDAVEAYKAADYWKEFKNIVGIDPSGIEGVNANCSKSGKAFNLSGMEVSDGYKGIVIRGGKKIWRR